MCWKIKIYISKYVRVCSVLYIYVCISITSSNGWIIAVSVVVNIVTSGVKININAVTLKIVIQLFIFLLPIFNLSYHMTNIPSSARKKAAERNQAHKLLPDAYYRILCNLT